MFGEIMLRLSSPEMLRFAKTCSLVAVFGGGEANVAVSLAKYGLPVDFATLLPTNDLWVSLRAWVRPRNSTSHETHRAESSAR